MPERICKYKILESIGGHSCDVLRAVDTKFGRTVAIKLLPGSADAEQRERLLAEARVVSGLRHDNLIAVYDVGEENGRLYLVMEFVEGESLRSAMTGMGLSRKLGVFREVAGVLQYVHSKGIIHRDVKPDNLFVGRDGSVKLIDFGVAKFEGLQLTAAGFTLGTPYYMPPEQIRGEAVTHLIDVYAFGITLFEALTLIRPVDGASPEQIFDRILNERLDLAPLRARNVPEHVIGLIERCTAKEKENRPQSFAEIAAALE